MGIQQHRIESWKVDKLREHPRQREMFPEHPPERFRAFVEDIREHGQRDPVEIAPDGTIFDGHHRVKAARELGWRIIDVVVLNELATECEAVQLQYMFDRNSQRRQMSELDIARAFRCIKASAGESNAGVLRDQIAKLLGCPKKGRTLERLVKVLEMPPAIPTALSHGRLKKTVAYELSKLPQATQVEIAERIENGEEPADVAADYVQMPKKEKDDLEDTPEDLYFVLMDFLKEHLDVLIQERDTVIGKAMNHEQAANILEQTAKLCAYLMAKERQARLNAIVTMKSVVASLPK